MKQIFLDAMKVAGLIISAGAMMVFLLVLVPAKAEDRGYVEGYARATLNFTNACPKDWVLTLKDGTEWKCPERVK